MSNKIPLILIIVALFVGGVLVLSKNKNQGMTGLGNQVQRSVDVEEKNEALEKEDEAPGKEDAEDNDEDESDKEEVTTVSLTDAGFEPQTVNVKVGAKVEWMNNANQTRNVSSASHTTHLVYPPLNLGNFEPGESVSLVFTEAGSYKYHDHLNPSKFGTVVVE